MMDDLADVPAGHGAVPERVPAAARVRAALPRAGATHCLDGDREFGVVLIERGSEVGGGDVRTDVGTVARILEASELARRALGARARSASAASASASGWPTTRTRGPTSRTGTDDPATDLDEHVPPGGGARSCGRVLALKAELAEPAVAATDRAEPTTPTLGCLPAWSAVAPLGPADQQRLLAAPGRRHDSSSSTALLAEEEKYLRARLRIAADACGQIEFA